MVESLVFFSKWGTTPGNEEYLHNRLSVGLFLQD
jgi:hypothetical protein